MSQTSNEAVYDFRSDLALSQKWKFRFDFFEKYGAPGSWTAGPPEYTAALRALTFADRLKIRMNFFAFFFSLIYLLVLGLWRKAIVWFGILFVWGIIEGLLGVSNGAANYFTLLFAIVIGMRTNVYYYQKRVKGIHDWSI